MYIYILYETYLHNKSMKLIMLYYISSIEQVPGLTKASYILCVVDIKLFTTSLIKSIKII